MFKKFFFILVLVFTTSLFGQNFVKHTVLEGETIQTIAQKYKVTPYDIYKLNPDSQGGVKPNSIVLIPKSIDNGIVKTETKPVVSEKTEVKKQVENPKESKTKTTSTNAIFHVVKQSDNLYNIAKFYKISLDELQKNNPNAIDGLQIGQKLLIKKGEIKSVQKPIAVVSKSSQTHTVKPKETLYAILKLYNISQEELENNNPFLKTDGLQPEQVLTIQKNVNPPKVKGNGITISHEVQPKETKYAIATKYAISVEELERQNPEVVDNLPIGFILKINKNNINNTSIINEIKAIEKPKEIIAKDIQVVDYIVKSGETLYSLTKKFRLSEASLISFNPELKDGLKEAMVIKVPANSIIDNEEKNSFKDLSKTIKKQNRKELVLFLPFNVTKVKNDSLTPFSKLLKKDKFLNMTLDFYSGALMAIDSARVLGINMDIKIFDSEETKNTTNALNIISNTDFSKTNAVIGPFYQVNVEKVAAVLENQNIPVISPLSKDEGKSFKNLYQSMPKNDDIKKVMFDYMNSKNGNIIAVIDTKKPEIKQYISDNYKEVKIVGLTDKAGFVVDSIKKHFVADRMNFVIMETENYYSITTTIKALESSIKNFQVQLVILEPNEMLNFEEIELSRLAKLKMAYPSISRDNDSNDAQKFEQAYKKKNKVLPNQYAVRGFDLTFDTMLRLAQDKSFEETITTATEQIDNKFDYLKKLSGGFVNNGTYILYYDTDLTIKQAE
ncbi:LysM peptidoglycan-binding domain-containing protein [Flavobacterium sp.]|uniref:amino acid ABC transporter substrate-binding protein n=1 Tax=Flavobacterium sp. TaxID=239 RepID=UPI003751D23F